MATKLGYSNPEAMLALMPAGQFAEWQQFFDLEPFGAKVEEKHLATISMQIANYLKPKGAEAFSLSDFMMTPLAKTQLRQKTVEELYNSFG